MTSTLIPDAINVAFDEFVTVYLRYSVSTQPNKKKCGNYEFTKSRQRIPLLITDNIKTIIYSICN